MSELVQVETVVLAPGEILEKAGKAGIQRIPAGVDDFRTWKHHQNQANVEEVQRVFIDYSCDVSDIG